MKLSCRSHFLPVDWQSKVNEVQIDFKTLLTSADLQDVKKKKKPKEMKE